MSDDPKIVKIKEAVRMNFEQSPQKYMDFERKYGFFEKLNSHLLSGMNLPPQPDILDVGCGAGASIGQILKILPSARVWGLDNSSAMLEEAGKTLRDDERVTLVEGDAARLLSAFDFAFDAIIYSASIFLIPDYRDSLEQAGDLLKPAGAIGLSFMDGVYDNSGRNLMQTADSEAQLGVSLKKPVKLSEFEHFFERLLPRTRIWRREEELSVDQLKEFFSIPAMSAGLFPGIPYEERVRRVGALFDHFPKCTPLFRWIFMVGEQNRLPE